MRRMVIVKANERSEAGALDRRWFALFVLCAGMLMVVLDTTVVNVALPSIQTDLGFSQAGLAWVVNAYLIAFGGSLLLAGRLGDLLGRKRIFLSGLALFAAASAVCGIAPSRELLVAARFAQGLAGAGASAVILGMIVTTFPEPGEQARALGVYSFVAAAGGAIGLLAGGILTQAINWHWVFFINVPIGFLTAILAVRSVDNDEGVGLAGGADIPGAILITSALMLAVYAIVQTTETGWGSSRTLALAAMTAALLAGFVAREARTRGPLVPLGIFRDPNVTGANLIQVLVVAGFYSMFFLGALYLQRVLGFGALEVGLAFLPEPVLIAGLSLSVAPRLVTRFGASTMIVTGLVLATAGLALFARAPLRGDYFSDVLPVMVLLGTGAGLLFPALMMVAMSGASARDAGLVSGLINMTAQVGGALGLAVLATLATARTSAIAAELGAATPPALLSGYQLAFGIGAGLMVVALVIASRVLRPAVRRSERLEEAA